MFAALRNSYCLHIVAVFSAIAAARECARPLMTEIIENHWFCNQGTTCYNLELGFACFLNLEKL